jgi:hypothetical protein
MPSDPKFNTLTLLTFQSDDELVYRKRVEQERPYGIDAALFASNIAVLINTLAISPSGAISPSSVSWN